jgi:23S rRNA (uracil1939-C5)-methyltransferase
VTIDALLADGTGTATAEGIPILVRGALPGERLLVRVVHSGRRYRTAVPLKVLAPSPFRIAPPCPHASDCEACPFIAFDYEAQRAWKREMVTEALSRSGVLGDLSVPLPLAPARTINYRNSAKLAIGGRSATPLIGIYRPRSHELLDIGRCPLHHPLINRIAAVVREGIQRQHVAIYSPRTGNGILRYLAVRVSEADNRALVVLVTAYRSFNELHHLSRYLTERVPEVAVVVQNVNPSSGNVIFGEQDYFLTRQRSIGDTIGSTRFTISPRSFFQVNNGGAELIYGTVRDWAALGGSERVLDLYCGVGGISLYLAPSARSVTGVEYSEAAVRDAESNARLNRVSNCTFVQGDTAELLEELLEEGERFDLAVLNPPRKGCDARVVDRLVRLAPQRIIYVSCSPESLARDLAQLARHGYVIGRVQPVDMFPQTPHVETVVLLQRSPC